jgi:hypothetical protein
MISLGTLGALAERRYTLRAYCATCDRWAELDLPALVTMGKGNTSVTFRARCSYCGGTGQKQLSPPYSPHSHANGWR